MKARENLLAVGVALGALGIFLPNLLHGLPGDIGLEGAERVLAGEMPYRDFWTMYAPGQFYLLASLFAVFGTHALVSAIAGTLLCASTVGLTWRLMARATGRWDYALVAAALFAAGFLANGFYRDISSYSPAIFFILVAFNLLEGYFERGRDRALIGAGLAIGVAALFKHDVGGYGALAMLGGVLVFRLVREQGAGTRQRVLRDPLAFALAAAVPVLPVVAALAVTAGYDAFWDTIWFPATIFGDVRGERYPSLLPTGLHDPWMMQMALNWSYYLYFAVPFLVWLASLPAIMVAARRGRNKVAALGTTLAIAFLFHYFAAHVQINTHIISMTFYGACLGVLFLSELTPKTGKRLAVPMRGLAVILFGGWLAALVAHPVIRAVGLPRTPMASLSLPKVSMMEINRDRAKTYAALVPYVQKLVPPGQPIYVGLRRHDIVIISRPMIYFIADRPPATRYHELHSGVVDTAPVQAEMIRDLRRKNVRLLVLGDFFSDKVLDALKREIRAKQPQIGAEALDRFIRANYAAAKRFGDVEVWLKKPAADLDGDQKEKQPTR